MTPAQWWVLWLGANEGAAILFYLWQRDYWTALVWFGYAIACVGLAMGSR